MSAPSRKRARVEDEDGDRGSKPPTPGLHKDDDVWLSDGSIVIISADNVAFRVHKSTLARRSEIFCDLFSLPVADASAAETVEGCPIVRVSDVSEDIRPLLSVLCCGKNYYFNGDAPLPVPLKILASLIRMAHKYAIQDVLNHALSRLKKYYTTDFATWMDTESRVRYVTTKLEDAPTVVELARLTNTLSLLPTAFLLCTELLTSYRKVHGGAYEIKVATLPAHDQAVLIAAKGCLMTKCAERSLCLLAAVPCAHCMMPEACKTAREAPLVALRESDASLDRLFFNREVSRLEPIAAEFWGDANWRMFCGRCRSALVEADEMERRWIWNGLPGLFGMGLTGDDWPSGLEDGGHGVMSVVAVADNA